jgi:fructuronate reductase
MPTGCATALAAWVLHLRGVGAPVNDAGGEPFVSVAATQDVRDAVVAVISALDAGLGSDETLIDAVVAQAEALT